MRPQMLLAEFVRLCYNDYVALPYRQQEGGEDMETMIALMKSVVAGVICHYICKWLDGENKGQYVHPSK